MSKKASTSKINTLRKEIKSATSYRELDSIYDVYEDKYGLNIKIFTKMLDVAKTFEEYEYVCHDLFESEDIIRDKNKYDQIKIALIGKMMELATSYDNWYHMISLSPDNDQCVTCIKKALELATTFDEYENICFNYYDLDNATTTTALDKMLEIAITFNDYAAICIDTDANTPYRTIALEKMSALISNPIEQKIFNKYAQWQQK